MAMIDNDWLPAIQGEFRKPYYKDLFQFVKDEYSRTVIYPPSEDIFNALHLTPLGEVKVLILGQDPYHNENQAHGLSKRRFRLPCRIFIRNCMTIWAVRFPITVIWKNGQSRVFYC